MIPKAYAANVSQNSTVMFDNTSTSVSSGSNSDGIIIAAHNSGETSDEAADDNANESTDPYSITLDEFHEYDTSIYVADITLSSVQYLKTAFAA